MSALVLDGSAALAWCFEDEETESTRRLRNDVRARGAVVPRLWRLEIVNALLSAEAARRLMASQTTSIVNLLLEMPIVIDDETDHRAFADTLHIARANKLTAYDSAYLELALRRALPLATLDRDLARAARRNGVPLLLSL